jgi:hypothetical protein
VNAGDGENRMANPFGSRTIPTDCGTIQVRWWGPADPVESIVLVHGRPGFSERYMEPSSW